MFIKVYTTLGHMQSKWTLKGFMQTLLPTQCLYFSITADNDGIMSLADVIILVMSNQIGENQRHATSHDSM